MWWFWISVGVVVAIIGVAAFLVLLGASILQRDIDEKEEEEQWRRHLGAC